MPVFPFEHTLMEIFYKTESPILNSLFSFLSGPFPWIILLGIVAGHFYQTKKDPKPFLLFLILGFASTDIMTSYFFKNLFSRLRPCHIDEYKNIIPTFGQGCGGRYGFFSAHAANSFFLAIFLMKTLKKCTWVFFTFAFLVSLSRVYLGVHFFSDIIVGGLWGSGIAYLYFWFYQNFRVANVFAPRLD